MKLLRSLHHYFKANPIQRLIVTVLVVGIIAMRAGMWGLPLYFDYSLRNTILHGETPEARVEAATELCLRCLDLPDTMARVRTWIDEAETDEEFLALRRVLRRIGKFSAADKNPDWQVRVEAIDLQAVADAHGNKPLPAFASGDPVLHNSSLNRQQVLLEQLSAITPSIHAPRIAHIARRDPDPRLRALAVMLESRLGKINETATHWAWSDPAPRVVAAIALQSYLRKCDVGPLAKDPFTQQLAAFKASPAPGREAKPEAIREWNFRADARRDAISNCALAMLRGGKPDAVQFITNTLDTDLEANLRDRLSWTVTHATRMPPLSQRAQAILRRIADGDKTLTERQVVAALLDAPTNYKTLDSIVKLCQTYWSPKAPLLFTVAPKTLQQLLDDKRNAGAITPAERAKALDTLRDMATAFQRHDKSKLQITATLSASAGCALWALNPSFEEVIIPSAQAIKSDTENISTLEIKKTALFYLRAPLASNAAEPVEFAAETLRDHPQAFALGRRLFVGHDLKRNIREFNVNVRFAGMMLMAIAKRTPAQTAEARELIQPKLKSKIPNEADTAACAMAILGDRAAGDKTRSILFQSEFPVRRTLLAMLETPALRREALDALLLSPPFPDWTFSDRRYLLVNEFFQPAVRRHASYLPEIPLAASRDLQRWLLRYWRAAYILQLQPPTKPAK
ncbi:MAG: hypothetical protein HN909_01680 [Phycisphaerales bacterium]|nr:hypothetical protein [Phycisphaerales bacterium]